MIPLALVGSVVGAAGTAQGMFPPLRRWMGYQMNHLVPNAILDPASYIQLNKWNELDDSTLSQMLRVQGFSGERVEQIKKLFRTRLNADQYITLARRGEIGEDEAIQQMEELGYTIEDISRLTAVTKFFPSPADLVKFAVREVYTPETVAEYGMDEDIPQKFLDEAFKTGMDEEQAQNFWAAHWMLPSINMGYEMFHRDIITEEQLTLLMKALDIMPGWRDALIKLSYNPLTRVDVRRMYGLGVLDRDGVFDSYRYAGYSPENAELMTQFTERYENSEYDGLSRSNIIDAFVKGIISQEELSEYLGGMGLSDSVVEFWVGIASYEKTKELVSSYKTSLVNAYRRGAMTTDDISARLTEQGMPTTYIQEVIDDTIRKEVDKIKVPTKADLYEFLRNDIISELEFTDYMKVGGWSDEVIQSYLTLYNQTGGAGKVKYLSVTKYTEWLGMGIMTEAQYSAKLKSMGVVDSDITKGILEVKSGA